MEKNEIKFKKIVFMLGVVGMVSCVMTTSVEAKSLANSFHGRPLRSYKYAESGKSGYYDCYEMSNAYTSSYTESKKYYLRAYVGGSKDSASGAVVDTKRVQYDSGDHSLWTDEYVYMRDVFGTDFALKYCGSGYGKTCYAKYGYQ